jgi:Ran GTPase-activating protein (RanGAP) involved in mRNA processing and transport
VLKLVIRSNQVDYQEINLLRSYLSKDAIQCINLNDNSLGNSGCQHLLNIAKSCTRLIELQLEGNAIGNKGAVMLSKCLEVSATLSVLNLCNNNIRDKGAMALKQCHHCRTVKVYLWSNKIAFPTISLLKKNEGYITFYV